MRGGGKEKGEVLMGNRRMACQCQKWSCAEERLGENEREDGRRAWLINLFTSMKMLRAPLWLKFSLPSIIAVAGLNLQSCRYQTLSKRSSLQPAPPPHSSSNKPIALSQQHNLHLILVTSSLVSKPSVNLLSVTCWVCMCVCLFIYSFQCASELLPLKTPREWSLCVLARFLRWCAFPTRGF